MGWTAPARAAEDGEPWTSRLTIEGQAALGHAPLGSYGVAVDVRLTQRFSLSAGAGLGAAEGDKVRARVGLMPRFTAWSSDGTSVGLGLGYSAGRRERSELYGPTPTTYRIDHDVWAPAHRLDGELSLVHRFASGLRLRAFGGLGIVLNGPERSVQGGDLAPNTGPDLPSSPPSPEGRLSAFAGLAIGVGAATPGAEPFPLSVRGWYGWQVLAFDVPSLLAMRAYVGRPDDPGGPVGDALALTAGAAIPTFFLAAPVVHLAHRHPWRAVGSLLARLIVPAASYVLYVTSGNEVDCARPHCDQDTAFLVGGVLTSLADAALVSWR